MTNMILVEWIQE